MKDIMVIDNKIKAVILMILSSASFAFMGVTVKLTGNLPVVEAVFFRNSVSLLIAFATGYKKNTNLWGKKENRKYLFMRALFGLIGVNCYFYAIRYMPLANSTIINKTSPIFVLIFAGILLKEKVTRINIVAMIIAIIGVVLVISPQRGVPILPAIIGLSGACCAGLAYTLVRFLGDKEDPSTIVFCFSLVSALCMLPIVILNWKNPSQIEWVFLILTGIFAAGGQYGLTFSYKYAPASEVSIYSYTNIIFSAIVGLIIWQEMLTLPIIIGGLLIIGSGIINYKKIS